MCYINAKWHLFAKSLVGDFAPQSLEYFGNIRCGVCSEANTVLIIRKKDELGAREKTIHFRVSEAFYEVIAHEAKQCGLSISEFCRRVLINRPIKKLPVIIHDEREIKQELRNINKLGNNLNQIARYLNEGGQMNKALSQEIRKTLTTLNLSIHDFNSAVEAEYGQSS